MIKWIKSFWAYMSRQSLQENNKANVKIPKMYQKGELYMPEENELTEALEAIAETIETLTNTVQGLNKCQKCICETLANVAKKVEEHETVLRD